MSKNVDLCGKWILFGTDKSGTAIKIDATVPGCVHTDLINANIINNIYYRDNSKSVQWIENNDFIYKKTFTVNDIKSNAFIEFDGLDTYSAIYLNGTLLGDTNDMFTPYEFFVDGILKCGENLLEVRFSSPIKKVADLPLCKGAFTRERMNTRRIQCTYGWDWVDRFVTMGIYRDVRLSFRESNEISSIYVFTKDINPYSAQLCLSVTFRDFEYNGDTVRIEIKAPDGRIVFEKERAIIKDELHEIIDVTKPELWYPNGYGHQPLYTVTVSTQNSEKVEKIGIRKITVLQIEDPEGSPYRELCLDLQKEDYLKKVDFNKKTSGFNVLVNGVKIMCKGGNFVPCEPFPSEETPEKITKLLELGAFAGVNMLRVWGGGIFERDEFYSECDRLGILVTQDFLMACGNYPEEEEWFISALKKETRAAALRLRNHPCLAYWTGDNENAVKGNENKTDFHGYRSAAHGIEPVLRELDPERYFFPSSPYGGDFYSSATCGTTHNTFFLGDIFRYIDGTYMTDYRYYFSKFISRFCAEQSVFGMSFVSSLKKHLNNEDIFGDDTSMIEYHTKTNPGLFKPLYEITDTMARKIFGDYTDGHDRIRKLQMLGCEWMRISLELYRRHKGFSWGIIYWMFNDCWPAASGWSMVDYYACPKPMYYAFRRAAKPAIAAISETDGRLYLSLCNDSLDKISGKAELYLYDFVSDNKLRSVDIPFTVDANSSRVCFECDYSEFESLMNSRTVLLCDMESDICSDRAIFIPKRYRDLDITYTEPRIISETKTEITVTSDSFTPFAMIDVPYLLSDNCFTLKKGESVVIKKIKKL